MIISIVDISIMEAIAFGFVLIVVALLIVEGLASYVLSFRERRTVLWATGRKRSTYDADIGWVNRPNTHIPDMYGPDRYLRINSQGFRSNDEFVPMVAEGRVRVICSGDSFTFAEGVDNDHTWCQLLASLDPRIEPVNMGQTGYGIDQAYLWYKRDGLKMPHQVHLLQFITDDFYRMQKAVFAGYAKPVLDIVNGRLVVGNVPVPRRSYYLTWLARHVRNFDRIRTIEFFQRAFRKVAASEAPDALRLQEARNKKTREVLRKIFEDLNIIREERHIQPALVYLPTLHETLGDGRDFQEWVEFLNSESKVFGIPLFDVLSDFRQLPVQTVVSMYIPETGLGPNHFNDKGNAFVARAIYDKLKTHRPIAEMLMAAGRTLADPSSLRQSGYAQRAV